MTIIDGKKVAQDIRAELKIEIDKLKEGGRGVPGLIAILVGEDPASQIYVRNKAKACDEVGIKTKTETPDAAISEEALLSLIESYNNNNKYANIFCCHLSFCRWLQPTDYLEQQRQQLPGCKP